MGQLLEGLDGRCQPSLRHVISLSLPHGGGILHVQHGHRHLMLGRDRLQDHVLPNLVKPLFHRSMIPLATVHARPWCFHCGTSHLLLLLHGSLQLYDLCSLLLKQASQIHHLVATLAG